MRKTIGIPQNRERVYTISIRKDIDKKQFKFPEKEELILKLKDMLEPKVDEKYYLSNEIIEKYIQNNNSENTNVIGRLVMDKWQDNMKRIYNINSYAPAINTMQGGNVEPKVLLENLPGAYGRNFGSKGKIQDTESICNTLQAAMGCGGGNIPILRQDIKIRKLIPLECWRLMRI